MWGGAGRRHLEELVWRKGSWTLGGLWMIKVWRRKGEDRVSWGPEPGTGLSGYHLSTHQQQQEDGWI